VSVFDASPWIVRFAGLVPPAGRVLDVAAGGGRHSRFFLDRGHPVTAVDRDLSGLEDLKSDPAFEGVELDLESGSPWPFAGRQFEAVVVTNYLHRPLLADIVNAVGPGGLLLYETFARGNERFGRPANPDFLLTPGELLDAARPALQVLAYEDLVLTDPDPKAVQRIAARNAQG
jgi:SAM-dependent methyltransferase